MTQRGAKQGELTTTRRKLSFARTRVERLLRQYLEAKETLEFLEQRESDLVKQEQV